MNSVAKNVLAVVVAIVVTGLLSTIVDTILESAGVLPKGNLNVSAGLIAVVIAYRTVFNAFGGWIAARMAASHKMRIALAIGIVGGVVSIGVAAANPSLGPVWYGVVLGLLAPPATWVGARLAIGAATPASPPPAES